MAHTSNGVDNMPFTVTVNLPDGKEADHKGYLRSVFDFPELMVEIEAKHPEWTSLVLTLAKEAAHD